MALAIRSQTSTTYASTTNTVLSAPAGLANDDILFAVAFTAAATTAPSTTAPAGFTQIGTELSVADSGGFNGRAKIFWKRAASESGSYTFTHTTCSSQGLLFAISGAVTSGSPIDVSSQNSGTTGSGASTTSTATSVTTTVANDLLMMPVMPWDGAGALTPPTGMTENFDSAGQLYLASVLQAAAGASANKTMTVNAATNPWMAWLVAIMPAGGATPSGTLAATETADTAALSGNTGTTGALASTEGTDSAAFAASAGSSGTLATTEATDTASISGSFSINGTLSTTEPHDTAAFSGNTVTSGALSVTEAQDTASFTSSSIVSGTLAATETTDSASLAGAVGTSGSLSTTEAKDSAALSGNFNISGSFAVTEARDTAAFSYAGIVSGVLSTTENADAAAFILSAVVPPPNNSPRESPKMYTGSLPTISNRADWKFQIGLVDSDTGENIDFTGCTIEIVIRNEDRQILSGDTSGKITVPEVGVFQVWFTRDDVRHLCAGSYRAGITITGNGETEQLFAGSVPVVDGVVQ